jgi:hypothetical protein
MNTMRASTVTRTNRGCACPQKSRSAEPFGNSRGLLETRITSCARVSTCVCQLLFLIPVVVSIYLQNISEYGSDISSMYPESSSPPGSGLERERIEEWLARSEESSDNEESDSEPEAAGMGGSGASAILDSWKPSEDDTRSVSSSSVRARSKVCACSLHVESITY